MKIRKGNREDLSIVKKYLRGMRLRHRGYMRIYYIPQYLSIIAALLIIPTFLSLLILGINSLLSPFFPGPYTVGGPDYIILIISLGFLPLLSVGFFIINLFIRLLVRDWQRGFVINMIVVSFPLIWLLYALATTPWLWK